jgi:hypothetical protein
MPHFWLVLVDPKTHITLWTLDEYVSVSGMQKSREKNFEDALDKLVGDLKVLTAQPSLVAK